MCQEAGCALGHGGGQARISQFSVSTEGAGVPIGESGKLPQVLTQELSPEGYAGIGKVKMCGIPGGGNHTAEARVRGQKVGHIWGDEKRPVGAAGGRGQGEGMGGGRASKQQGTVVEC